MRKSLLIFVALLFVTPFLLPMTGCSWRIGSLQCDFGCNDGCSPYIDIKCIPETECTQTCYLALSITDLGGDNCMLESAMWLPKKTGGHHVYDKDSNGDPVYHSHGPTGERDILLHDCLNIDPNDPLKTLEEFKSSIDEGGVGIVVKTCVVDESCLPAANPGEERSLKIVPLGTDIAWTATWDEDNCKVKISMDGEHLVRIIPCEDCCNNSAQ
jgi:hypothetical protein